MSQNISNNDPRIITCVLGGSFEEKFLIDSGATINFIPLEVWERLWADEDSRFSKNRNITAYGGKQLNVYGTFKAWIVVKESSKPRQFEEFIIVDENGRSLLSFNTANKLKVLKIGAEVNLVSNSELVTKQFPKFPGKPIKFNINPTVRPIKNSSYRIPASLEHEVEKQLENLEALGIIEKARFDSPWMSRMDVVIKDKTKWRLVLDMREVNKAIYRETYPLPTMEKFHAKLFGARFFTKFDLKSAFHHLELDEESRDLTTFMTPKGARRFTRLLFGVNCAPEIFQKTMDNVFRGLDGVIVYIDDILIFADTIEKLEQLETEVRQRLTTHNLTLNEEKCYRRMETVDFLGWKVSNDGISPSDEKVKAIANFRPPTNKQELKSFIGFATFISPAIQSFANIMEPLNQLLRKDSRDKWGEKHDEAFNKIKELVGKDVLTRAFFGIHCPTGIYTDASETALGAVIVQMQKDSVTGEIKQRVVACASKTLTCAERRYPQTQKEALAVVWGVEKYNYYLLGREFVILTDHKPLQFIFTRSKANDKRSLTRAEAWALRLSMYNFRMEYVPSERNIADPLSRMCVQLDDAFDEEDAPHEIAHIKNEPSIQNIESQTLAITIDQIRKETAKDETLIAVSEALQTNRWSPALHKFESIKGDLQYKRGFLLKENRFILPTNLREKALEIAHETHPGITTMKRFLRSRLWWPGMDGDITKKVEQCDECILLSKDPAPAPMKRTSLPHKKWEYLAIDFYSAKNPDVIILVIVDFYSRFTRAKFVKTTDFKSTIKALEETFSLYMKPKKILCDNGPPFQGADFKNWCEENGIKLVHSTPLWPRENGMVERFMKNLTRVLTIAKRTKQKPEIAVERLIYNYNRRPHSTTGEIPLIVMLGQDIFDQLPSIETAWRDEVSDDEEFSEMKILDATNKGKAKEYSDKYFHAKPSNIQIGDQVVVKNVDRSKLAPNFHPRKFKVIEKTGEKLILKDDEGAILKRNTALVKKFSPFLAQGEEQQSSQRLPDQPIVTILPPTDSSISPVRSPPSVPASRQARLQKRTASSPPPQRQPRVKKIVDRFVAECNESE